MSRGPEAAFWKRVRSAWSGHAVRVEASDGEADVGTPDCVLSAGYRGGWIELKVWPDNVSREQLVWHIDAVERGAYAMVLSDVGGGRAWLGDAEEYYSLVLRGKRPRGVVLQRALDVVRCALIRAH